MKFLSPKSARALQAFCLAGSLLACVPAPASAVGKLPGAHAKDGGLKPYVEGQVLVKFKPGRTNLATASGRSKASDFAEARAMDKLDDLEKPNIALLRIKDGKSVERKVKELQLDPDVEYAEPNFRRELATIGTDDPFRDILWGLDNTGQTVGGSYGVHAGTADRDIDAPEAWAIDDGTHGTVIVAVLDTGVAYNHPDLAPNMWDGTNCKDENGNALGGCQHGYDYDENDKVPLPSTDTHGTHVAGTIAAAKNNNTGIIGVAPRAKIMAVKFGLTVAQEVKGIDFAIQNGAKVINASFGGNTFSQSEYDAIDRFRTAGGIFVAAAGNNGGNNDGGLHFYPSDHTLDNVISVAATDANDALATFSNYGATSVDVGAPGTNIYSSVATTTVATESFTGVTVPALPAGWSATGDWATSDFSGNKVLAADPAHVPYAPNADTRATSPAIDLSTAGGAYMNVMTRCDTDYQTSAWTDYVALEFSSDGTNFTEFERWDEAALDMYNGESPLNSSGAAQALITNISIPTAYLTANFTYRFRWVADASNDVVASYEGCWVDDIAITKFTDGSNNMYAYLNGTSMATPHVVGLAALLWGYNPSLTRAQVKAAILNTGDAAAALSGKSVSGKRINAQAALISVNPAKAITSFAFNGLSPAVTGTINETDHTVAATVPYGTNVTALVPTIAITGASVNPASGAAQNFTNPVTYTVTAADTSTQAYVVTVTIAPPSSVATVTSSVYTVTAPSGGSATIANVPSGTARATFLANIAMGEPHQAWNTAGLHDPVLNGDTLVVTAQDGTTTVTYAVGTFPSDGKAITSFIFAAFDPDAVGVINETDHTVAATVPFGTNVAVLVPTVTVSQGASVNPASGAARDFTNPVTYTVTALDASAQAYTVTVTVGAQPAAPVIASVAGDGLINDAEKTAIHMLGTAPANALVTVTLTNGANAAVGTQQLTGGGTSFDIVIDGTAAQPAPLADGTINVSATARDAIGSVSNAAATTATKDTVAPAVTKLGDGTADVTIPVGDTPLVFDGALSASGKAAAERALSAGADTALSYAWSGATLTITASAVTTFANDAIAVVQDAAGNAAKLLLVDSALAAGQIAPDAGGFASMNPPATQLVLADPTLTVTLNVSRDVASPTIDAGPLVLNGMATLPQMTVTAANAASASFAIPASTVVTADPSWDGVIAAPTLANVTIPSTPTE
ncbi:MAG TPA: S8 family serine peptidase, partial [Candidatus Binatia bacterium]|nr:S8 family serine peptidase [Candidatus Binatia bacterium]